MTGIRIQIRKELTERDDYNKSINNAIVEMIGEHIGKKLGLIDNPNIFKGKSVPIGFYIERYESIITDENPYIEDLLIKIEEIPIQEFQTKVISRMEELKINNDADRATLKERLKILFKGRVEGGYLEIFPKRGVNK